MLIYTSITFLFRGFQDRLCYIFESQYRSYVKLTPVTAHPLIPLLVRYRECSY